MPILGDSGARCQCSTCVHRVELSVEEREQAEREALRRYHTDNAIGAKGRNGAPVIGDDALRLDRLGAFGEMAVAVLLGIKNCLFRETKPRRGSCDLPHFDVKTSSRHHGDLIVQFDGPPDQTYVLATVQGEDYRVHGWMHASEAMQPQWKADPLGYRPAYFVPQARLHPMSTITYSTRW